MGNFFVEVMIKWVKTEVVIKWFVNLTEVMIKWIIILPEMMIEWFINFTEVINRAGKQHDVGIRWVFVITEVMNT